MFLAPEFVFILFVLAIVGFGVIGVYLLPSLIAFSRGHNNLVPIFLFNLVLGWTMIGWVLALVWSLTDNVRFARRFYVRY